MQLTLDATGKELKDHGSFEFPVFISHEQLSNYEQHSFAWHYHPEIELTLILSGSMYYQINDKTYLLSAGDGIFCNSNALHTGRETESGEDCRYLSVTFSARMLRGFTGSRIQQQYIDPILSSTALSSVFLSPQLGWQQEILEALESILQLDTQKEDGYEIRLLILLLQIWSSLYHNAYVREEVPSASAVREIERLRRIMDYIHAHYAEHITLDDIAAQINICRSECCRFFKRRMKISLFDYLLDYRIRQSLSLLSDTALSITEISEKTGFSTPAYYAKVFRERIHMSPGTYRKQSKH